MSGYNEIKIAVITGASRGIGFAVASELAKNGYELIINGRDEERLVKAREELSKAGVTVSTVSGDIGSYETAERLRLACEELIKHKINKKISLVLINNAGISHIGLLQEMSIDEWQELISVNLSGVFYTCKAFIPLMLRLGGGRIINISSVWGEVGASCETAYSASKGGVNALTRALGKELAPSNISVNALSLGAMDTDMNACFSEAEKEALCEEIPKGRFGTPKEAAELVLKLCESGTYLTSQVIRLDGGWI